MSFTRHHPRRARLLPPRHHPGPFSARRGVISPATPRPWMGRVAGSARWPIAWRRRGRPKQSVCCATGGKCSLARCPGSGHRTAGRLPRWTEATPCQMRCRGRRS